MNLQDLYALNPPKIAVWNNSGPAWLFDVYDWDTVIVEKNDAAALSFELKLCVGLFPCSIWIKGNPKGKIRRLGNGFFSCLSGKSCGTIKVEGIEFFCDRDSAQPQHSIFKIIKSSLTIVNSSFTGCTSMEDGGVIQSFQPSSVVIRTSRFSDSHMMALVGPLQHMEMGEVCLFLIPLFLILLPLLVGVLFGHQPIRVATA